MKQKILSFSYLHITVFILQFADCISFSKQQTHCKLNEMMSLWVVDVQLIMLLMSLKCDFQSTSPTFPQNKTVIVLKKKKKKNNEGTFMACLYGSYDR